ncbi:uncharacterized protein CHSO_2443 [Chryseobacterium sp. StRB126]|uniref:hypothetical protein n=1 Tax=Chryseobacterium sp. StRB126 TaxID=878220 RepID=UPI0004E993DC|nr:hypothetical protein [Chryseobacterium sp. StRB126]BAP31480.1 uncharacterized protein CHSO_2443 [Chryseobacterium sp. StRB126]
MDKETIYYIVTYFSNLMTHDEKSALRHHIYTYKTSTNSQLRKILTDKGWLNTDHKIITLLQNGFDEFERNTAQRILAETPEKVFFNTCPQCNKLARTPYAKQCRYCQYSWHNLMAKFKIDSVFQLTNRSFYLLGEIVEGEIHPGQLMDLTTVGLHKKIKIESIELGNKPNNGKPWNGIGLGTNELTEEDKLYLKQQSSLHPIINIITAQPI